MAYAASVIRGLRAGLLVLATLATLISPGLAKTFVRANADELPRAVLDNIVLGHQQVPTAREVQAAASDAERPYRAGSALPGMARCPTTFQCITVWGGVPAAACTVPPPSAGIVQHALIVDDPSHGITTPPDLRPPRLSA